MCRLSNTLIIIINILTLLISIPMLFRSIESRIHEEGTKTECQKIYQTPLLAFAVFLFTLSLLGILGSCCRSLSWLLWIYIFVMFFMIIGLSIFTIFAFVITNQGAGEAVSGTGFKEYKLGDYSHWLQKHVVDDPKWENIKSCLIDTQTCQQLTLISLPDKQSDFYKRSLSSLQSGCCKPPMFCGFTYVNATYWEAPTTGPAAGDSDCTTWSNDQDILCYNCKSCKGGFLASLKSDWRRLTIFNASLILFLIVIYTIAGCAFRNSRRDYKPYRAYP